MLRNLFNNIPDVTKNLLIINLLFFLAKIVLKGQGIDLDVLLGMHYPASTLFEPYQIITHMFMHGDFFHLLFNMIGLLVLGSHLERHWGKKRYFIFYFITALGAVVLHSLVQGIEIHQLTGEWFPEIQITNLTEVSPGMYSWTYGPLEPGYGEASSRLAVGVVGASGAIYGLLMAFALLFPNTEFQLLFPPVPIKAKWLALILGGFAVYNGYLNSPNDSMAHFAHLGGMIFGFIMIQIWKRDRGNFY